jgi:hypothetical protein
MCNGREVFREWYGVSVTSSFLNDLLPQTQVVVLSSNNKMSFKSLVSVKDTIIQIHLQGPSP